MKSSGLLEYALGADAGSLKQVVIGTGEVAAESRPWTLRWPPSARAA